MPAATHFLGTAQQGTCVDANQQSFINRPCQNLIQDHESKGSMIKLLSLPTDVTIKLSYGSDHNSPTITLMAYFVLSAAQFCMMSRDVPHLTTLTSTSHPSATRTTPLPIVAYTQGAPTMTEATTSRQARQLLRWSSTPHP